MLQEEEEFFTREVLHNMFVHFGKPFFVSKRTLNPAIRLVNYLTPMSLLSCEKIEE